MLKKTVKAILPPFIHEALRKIFYPDKYSYHPAWHTIKAGNLKGRQLFIDPRDGLWQQEMLEGRYDRFLFDYLRDFPMKGKIVFEIGAHIGFQAMNFALLVGDEGMVYAFEPNTFNCKRMEINVGNNPDLAGHIKIFEVAVSDRGGETIFYTSDDVDSGRSSGSFTPQSHAFFQNNKEYIKLYRETRVLTVTLDEIYNFLKKEVVPDVIKVDVEDAETSVLEGGINFIRNTTPLLLLEIHSIFSMFNIYKLLTDIGYNIKLLKEEPDGRCFIAAEPPKR